MFQRASQAEGLRLALAAEGIRAVVQDQSAIGIVGGPASVSILDERDYGRARAVITRLEASTPSSSAAAAPDDLVRHCPHCGAESPTNFTACWRCQTDLSAITPVPPQAGLEVTTPSTVVPDQPTDLKRRSILALELAIVLVLTFWTLPVQVWERFISRNAPPTPGELLLVQQVSYAVRYTGFGALVLFLIWRWAGSVEPTGLARLKWWKEVLFAAVILAATVGVGFVASFTADSLGLPRWSNDAPSRPGRPGPFYPVLLLTAAFEEEAVFRAYLITRLEQLVGRTAPAVVASAALFALRHAASPARTFELFCGGLLWGAIFASVRRLPRLVLAHWAWNMFVIYGRP